MKDEVSLELNGINDRDNTCIGGNVRELVNLAGRAPTHNDHHLSHPCSDGIDRDDVIAGRFCIRTDQVDKKKLETLKAACFSGGHDGPFDPTQFHESPSDEV